MKINYLDFDPDVLLVLNSEDLLELEGVHSKELYIKKAEL